MIKIIGLRAFQDNYIWVLQNTETQSVCVVDPGEAKPVIDYLQETGQSLAAILVTHHHFDHTGGISELLNFFNKEIPVFGGAEEPIPHLTHPLKENDSLPLASLGFHLSVIEIPGHTKRHIAYYGHNSVFTGDTLFTGGCGKIFEGTPQEMFSSLAKLKKLPEDTLVYCGHEYTEQNLSFALTVDPSNLSLLRRFKETQQKTKEGKACVPATIKEELNTNPFLRMDVPEIQRSAEIFAGHALLDDVAIFYNIRLKKDQFKPQKT